MERIERVRLHLGTNDAAAAPETGGVGHGDAVIREDAPHPLEDLHAKGATPRIPKVGDATMFDPDYIGGLRTMISKADPNSWLSFYDNFNEDVLIVLKPEHVTEVLDSTVEHALHGLKPASEAFFGKKVLFVLHGDEWQHLRRVMRPAFSPGNSLDAMTDDTMAKAQVWADLLDSYASAGQDVDMLLACSMFHLSSVSIAAFNYDLKCIENFEDGPNEVNKSFELMLTELPRRAFSPDPSTQNDFESDNDENRAWKQAAQSVRDVVTSMVEERLKLTAAGKPAPDDLLSHMIAAYEREGECSAEQLVEDCGDNLIEVLFAGYNTVVNVIANALYFVAKNPEWFPKLQAEIDAVKASHWPPTLADVKNMKQCILLFQESLRLAPPAAVIARLLVEDIELDGMTIPKGVEVCLPAFALHTDKRVWGADAEQFNPERFLGGAAKMPGLVGGAPERGSFIPFSDGARSCLGRHFAQLEAVCAFAILLEKYEFKVPEDYDWSLIFTGFGYRPWDAKKENVGLRLIPVKR